MKALGRLDIEKACTFIICILRWKVCKRHFQRESLLDEFGRTMAYSSGFVELQKRWLTHLFILFAGEVIPDSGEAKVCGLSIGHQTASARQNLGYCPQFSALPGALTGREVLWMYARLRGVVPGLVPSTVDSLLSRLDLMQFADRCDSPHF